MYNHICLVGRLTKDVDLRQTQRGTPVAAFTIAVDRDFKNQNGEKETDFFNVIVWGKLGENCNKYLGKGKMALVAGRLQIRKYQTEKGENRYSTEVIAEQVKFLSPKHDAAPSGHESSPLDTIAPLDDLSF